MTYHNEIRLNRIIGASLVAGFLLASTFAHAAPANWCKGRAESDCTASEACSWRVVTTDGVSKSSCIYNSKAARELLSKQFTKN